MIALALLAGSPAPHVPWMADVALIDIAWLALMAAVWLKAGRLRPLAAAGFLWVVIEIVAHGAMETAVARAFLRFLP